MVGNLNVLLLQKYISTARACHCCWSTAISQVQSSHFLIVILELIMFYFLGVLRLPGVC